MSGAIAIFVKTPSLSPVKTRLAKKIGQKKAEQFHLLASQAVAETVQAVNDVQGYFAVAEQTALTHTYWQQLPTLWQYEGGLGERMGFIYQTLLKKHDFVILVGADIPQMTALQLSKASHCLLEKQTEFSFAATEDGGFWLFGGNQLLPKNLWTEVIYSQENTGDDFLKAIQPLGSVQQLDCLRDVDDFEDLQALKHVLIKLKNPTISQKNLLRFYQ